MESKRRKFQGVLNILSFNRHFYFFGLGILLLVIASRLFFDWSPALYWIVIVSFIYGLVMPLIISAYVYDYSGFYRFDWLANQVGRNDQASSIVNINAGFDETSFILKRKFPDARIQVFDFYNSERHTEPAIKRARRVSDHFPGTRSIPSHAIPGADREADLVFLLSAVHEIRSHQEKVNFLKECKRVCREEGKVIMVEHLRDLPNFLAFTVGFTHFFSRRTWKKAFAEAGFSDFRETKFTPFMSIFNCKP